jgi:7-carboxy-7-deazaguanine synthase
MISPAIVELTSALRDLGSHITIETAGTVFQPVACDLMSISPKLANSVPIIRDNGRWAAQHERLRWQPDILRRLMDAYPYQLKFVVSAPTDMDEIDRMLKELNTSPEQVLLMPEGIDSETLRQRGDWVVELCKQRGYRFSPRLHVELWGARRGV